MKHLKQYKSENMVGLYVAIIPISPMPNGLKNIEHFLNNNIGIIIYSDYPDFKVKYDKKIPNSNYINAMWFNIQDILHISKSKEECELYLHANKYNL